MDTNALGMIETKGLVGAIEAADAMVKATAKPVTAKASPGYKKVVFEGKTRKITKKQKAETATAIIKVDDSMLGKACPVCGKGIIIKGKTAYGCSDWKNGCTFRQGF